MREEIADFLLPRGGFVVSLLQTFDGISHTTVGPCPPRLDIGLPAGGHALQFRIYGDVGYVHTLQQSGSLSSPNWQTRLSATLTSDPQLFTLALPTTNTFWRVVAHD
jgi:hypothetical protein